MVNRARPLPICDSYCAFLCTQPLHGAAEKVIELTPLVPLNTARLLCRLSPRALLLNEIPGATNGADFVRKLATHPLIIALKG